MITSIKERPNVGTIATALKASQWRNVIFDKRGKSHLGTTLFDTPAKAERQLRVVFRECEQSKSQGCRPRFQVTGGWFFFDEYAWHMQIPIIA